MTNLTKLFWPGEGISKRDLLQYDADISGVLLPHLKNRALVMKRYPNGASQEFFFQKRIPEPHPEWIQTCEIRHASGDVIHFPMVQGLASLLWVVNLVRTALLDLKIPSSPKTSRSRGVHIYVPIRRGPAQKQVWGFAKELARSLAARFPQLTTAEYRVARRPLKHVLVDYNQKAWGRTLASVYSVRAKPGAVVSTPVGWDEIERGFKVQEFRIDNVPQRVRRCGDLFHPLLLERRRIRLEQFL